MRRRYAVSFAALAFGPTAAFAADIPVAATVFKAPAQVSDWNGFYIGGSLGFRSTQTDVHVNSAVDTTRTPPFSDRFLSSACNAGFPCVTGRPYNADSVRFSPYFGYNWQANSHWILGIEADVAFGSHSITTNNYYPATPFRGGGELDDSFSVKADWDASIRARVGYLITPGLMIYGTGGPAWLRVQSTSNCSTRTEDDGECASGNGFIGLSPSSLTHSTTRLGATVGGGLEAMLTPNWIVRGEYRYSDYGTISNTDVRTSPTGVQTVKYDLSTKTHVATFGLAYKFGEYAHADASPLAAYGAMPISTTWTGAYVGTAVGVRANQTTAAVGSAVITRPGDPPVNVITGCECFLDSAMNTTSARFSPYIGYNYQFSPKWLVGIEGDFGWANRKSTLSGNLEPGAVLSSGAGMNDNYSVTTKWDASLRLRLGYIVSPSLMIYGTAGPAMMSLEETSQCDTSAKFFAPTPLFSTPKIGMCAPGLMTPVNISNSSIRPGFTIGGGGEAKLSDHWVLRAEYRYSDFGTAKFDDSRSCNGFFTLRDPVLGTVGSGCHESDVVQTAVRARTNTAMFGLAYKFD